MKRILTPDEFIIRSVNNFPSLFAALSYEEVKFRILDHVLNTIGNGLYTKDFMGKPVTKKEIADAQKWFQCSEAAYGYTKTYQLGDDPEFRMPEGDPIVVPINEMENYPDIVHWVEFNCSYKSSPYPNFSKQYSTVWDERRIKFVDLGVEWMQAADWFYRKCQDYFLDNERVLEYHTAFPKSTEWETKNTIEDCKEIITNTTRYPDNAAITEAYECEFIGDTHNDEDVANFILRRWNTEHKRILDFIQETLVYINTLIQ